MAQSKREIVHLSTVIIRLEAIDKSIADATDRSVKQARRYGAAAALDDLGETLHRIATTYRNQAPV